MAVGCFCSYAIPYKLQEVSLCFYFCCNHGPCNPCQQTAHWQLPIPPLETKTMAECLRLRGLLVSLSWQRSESKYDVLNTRDHACIYMYKEEKDAFICTSLCMHACAYVCTYAYVCRYEQMNVSIYTQCTNTPPQSLQIPIYGRCHTYN